MSLFPVPGGLSKLAPEIAVYLFNVREDCTLLVDVFATNGALEAAQGKNAWDSQLMLCENVVHERLIRSLMELERSVLEEKPWTHHVATRAELRTSIANVQQSAFLKSLAIDYGTFCVLLSLVKSTVGGDLARLAPAKVREHAEPTDARKHRLLDRWNGNSAIHCTHLGAGDVATRVDVARRQLCKDGEKICFFIDARDKQEPLVASLSGKVLFWTSMLEQGHRVVVLLREQPLSDLSDCLENLCTVGGSTSLKRAEQSFVVGTLAPDFYKRVNF